MQVELLLSWHLYQSQNVLIGPRSHKEASTKSQKCCFYEFFTNFGCQQIAGLVPHVASVSPHGLGLYLPLVSSWCMENYSLQVVYNIYDYDVFFYSQTRR